MVSLLLFVSYCLLWNAYVRLNCVGVAYALMLTLECLLDCVGGCVCVVAGNMKEGKCYVTSLILGSKTIFALLHFPAKRHRP
jgi:hypothetical protein